MARLVVALAALALAAPATAAAQSNIVVPGSGETEVQTPGATGSVIERAASELRSDPVYVDPSQRDEVPRRDERAIEQAVTDAGGRIYLAVLPSSAAAAAGGSAFDVARLIGRDLDRPGVYGVVAGRRFDAGATAGAGLSGGQAGDFARQATEENPGRIAEGLRDFVGDVAAVRTGGVTDDAGGGSASGDSGAGGLLALLAIFAGGFGLVAFLRGRRRRREQAEQTEELRRNVDEDVVALGEDIRALDLDVEMPGADPRAKADYARALEAYDGANAAIAAARRPSDFEPITERLEKGRYAMEAAKARLRGDEPPEHRPPCFFDPRHGPSVRDVEWEPPGGAPRLVPACAADAVRIDDGEDPHTRELEIGGRRMPWYQAPGYYAPYGGGFFGGFGGGGLLTGLLAGSLIGGAWSAPVAYGDVDPGGGDFGGGGDF